MPSHLPFVNSLQNFTDYHNYGIAATDKVLASLCKRRGNLSLRAVKLGFVCLLQ